MAERDGLTEICSSGKIRLSTSEAALTSPSTRKLKLRERSNSSQISNDTSPGERPCTRICVGVTTKASATVGSVTETRFSRSVVLMSKDLPTITRSGAAPCPSACGACKFAGGIWAFAGSGVVAAGAAWTGGGGAGCCCWPARAEQSRHVIASTTRDDLPTLISCSHHWEQIGMYETSEPRAIIANQIWSRPSCRPGRLPLDTQGRVQER